MITNTYNNIKEAQSWLARVYSLNNNNSKKDLEKIRHYAKLLECLINQAKGNVNSDFNISNILEAELWLNMIKNIPTNKKEKEDIEFIQKRINLLEWLISRSKQNLKEGALIMHRTRRCSIERMSYH
ncbi:hypothetical protein [Virgibacillus proomii]|uniref:hypothetical protein n=1 Tax=Virgibacillus proomii TaxID=84407 RepID=UPI001C101E69|nr:hypothetical protein [Virgibacillus proomii]MBU5267883.1 hypothetical protein [Virgibacillus proomii]